MPARQEGGIRPRPDEFKVEATGTDQIFNWLKLSSEQGGDRVGIGPEPPTSLENNLMLGEVRLKSPLREVLVGISHHDDNRYHLSANFILQSGVEELHREMANPLRGLFREMNGERPASRLPDPMDLEKLQSLLEHTLAGQGLSVAARRPDGDGFLIEGDDSTSPGTKFEFHKNIRDGKLLAYCLHIDEEVPNSEAVFTQQYQLFTRLLEHVTATVCRACNTNVPGTQLVLSPPGGLKNTIERASRQRKLQRRMLEASGLVELDPEELKSRIVMEKPDVTFDQIGGLERAKEELASIVLALKDPKVYEDWGTSPPKGVLLFGPPGTGKTLLARALANAADAHICSVQATDIVHALYGRSEKLVQAYFDAARAENKPVIIFFDEIDALTQHRGRSTEVTSRIVSTILTNLDGLKSDSGNNTIIVVATTNQLEAIDRALLRPGRFDMLIEVPLPQEEERRAIFEIHLNAAFKKARGRPIFDSSLDKAQLVRQTQGLSGADIKEVIRRALAAKVRQQRNGQKPTPVTTKDIATEIEGYERIRKAKARPGFSQADPNNSQP